jgi:hypothetical protein
MTRATSAGNPHLACSEEWWHFEVAARMQAYARGEDRTASHARARGRTDWLAVEVVRWEDKPSNFWDFHEALALGQDDGPDGTGVGLFQKLNRLLQVVVDRLAVEADGIGYTATVGWIIRAGQLTIGVRGRPHARPGT